MCNQTISVNVKNVTVYRKTRRCSHHQLEARPFEKFLRNVVDSEKLQPDYRIQSAIPSGQDKQEQPRNPVSTSHEKSKYNNTISF